MSESRDTHTQLLQPSREGGLGGTLGGLGGGGGSNLDWGGARVGGGGDSDAVRRDGSQGANIQQAQKSVTDYID